MGLSMKLLNFGCGFCLHVKLWNYDAAVQFYTALMVGRHFFSHHIFHASFNQNLYCIWWQWKSSIKQGQHHFYWMWILVSFNFFLARSFWLHTCFLLAFHLWIYTHLFGRCNLPLPPTPPSLWKPFLFCVTPTADDDFVFWLHRRLSALFLKWAVCLQLVSVVWLLTLIPSSQQLCHIVQD